MKPRLSFGGASMLVYGVDIATVLLYPSTVLIEPFMGKINSGDRRERGERSSDQIPAYGRTAQAPHERTRRNLGAHHQTESTITHGVRYRAWTRHRRATVEGSVGPT